jgi:hypothetical protein
MTREDIYDITLKVQEQYEMSGLGAPEPEMCLYADFAVDVAVRAIRLKINELANTAEKNGNEILAMQLRAEA